VVSLPWTEFPLEYGKNEDLQRKETQNRPVCPLLSNLLKDCVKERGTKKERMGQLSLTITSYDDRNPCIQLLIRNGAGAGRKTTTQRTHRRKTDEALKRREEELKSLRVGGGDVAGRDKLKLGYKLRKFKTDIAFRACHEEGPRARSRDSSIEAVGFRPEK